MVSFEPFQLDSNSKNKHIFSEKLMPFKVIWELLTTFILFQVSTCQATNGKWKEKGRRRSDAAMVVSVAAKCPLSLFSADCDIFKVQHLFSDESSVFPYDFRFLTQSNQWNLFFSEKSTEQKLMPPAITMARCLERRPLPSMLRRPWQQHPWHYDF